MLPPSVAVTVSVAITSWLVVCYVVPPSMQPSPLSSLSSTATSPGCSQGHPRAHHAITLSALLRLLPQSLLMTSVRKVYSVDGALKRP